MRQRKPGWAVDPNNENFLRWWDGESWTDSVRSNVIGPYGQSRIAVKLAPIAIFTFTGLLVALLVAVLMSSPFALFRILNDFTVMSFGLVAVPSLLGSFALLLDKMKKIPALVSSCCWAVGVFGIVILVNYLAFLVL